MKRILTLALFALFLAAGTLVHADEPVAEKLELKDGGMLFMHPDGTSRMVDAHGKKMEMSDGVEMELKDGRKMMMKNHQVWMRHGPPGKGHEGMMND